MKTLMLKLGLIIFLLSTVACDKKVPEESEDPKKAAKIHLHREYQYTYRYNCLEELESEGYETVQSPKKRIRIAPKNDDVIGDSDFWNETSGDSGPATWNFTSFNINLSPTIWDLKVEKGLNRLGYRFTFADGRNEEGFRHIDISYSENYNDEPRHIYPDEEECNED